MKRKADQKCIKTETNARRVIAKSWALLAHHKTVVRETCDRLSQILEDEIFDGILQNLNGRNGLKSYSCQKRILRRIVEKRQAQSAHRLVGRRTNWSIEQMQCSCAPPSLSNLQCYQQCA